MNAGDTALIAFIYRIVRGLFMKKVRFSTYVLILFFSIFAMSPLSYSHGETFAEKNAYAHETKAFFKNINIFLLEVLFSKIGEHPECPDNVPVNRVIVKKSSTLLRQTVKIRLKSLKSPVIPEVVRVPEYPAYALLSQQHENKKHKEFFVTTYSGLSPPRFILS